MFCSRRGLEKKFPISDLNCCLKLIRCESHLLLVNKNEVLLNFKFYCGLIIWGGNVAKSCIRLHCLPFQVTRWKKVLSESIMANLWEFNRKKAVRKGREHFFRCLDFRFN